MTRPTARSAFSTLGDEALKLPGLGERDDGSPLRLMLAHPGCIGR